MNSMKKILINICLFIIATLFIGIVIYICFEVIKTSWGKNNNTYYHGGLTVLGTWTNYSLPLVPRMTLVLSQDKMYKLTACNTLEGTYTLDEKQHMINFLEPSQVLLSETPCEHDFSQLVRNISKQPWEYLITTGRTGYRMNGPLEMYIMFNTGIPGEFNYIKMSK